MPIFFLYRKLRLSDFRKANETISERAIRNSNYFCGKSIPVSQFPWILELGFTLNATYDTRPLALLLSVGVLECA